MSCTFHKIHRPFGTDAMEASSKIYILITTKTDFRLIQLQVYLNKQMFLKAGLHKSFFRRRNTPNGSTRAELTIHYWKSLQQFA